MRQKTGRMVHNRFLGVAMPMGHGSGKACAPHPPGAPGAMFALPKECYKGLGFHGFDFLG